MEIEIIIIIVLLVSLLLIQLILLANNPFIRKRLDARFKSRSKTFKREGVDFFEPFCNNITQALRTLSENHIGSIIALERKTSLEKYVELGVKVNTIFIPELVISIFAAKTSPLHDGAIILRGDQIHCASAYFPSSPTVIDTKYGARHRAAIGVTEQTDAMVFVVSETSGKLSFVINGRLRFIKTDDVKPLLQKNYR